MTEEGNYLNQLVQCLLDQEKWNSISKRTHENIPLLHQNTQQLVKQYQQHFLRCRKYNQAKIHRKYEIIINDLQTQNTDLKAKLHLELSARPSSQKYVSDLVDKMVALQNHNAQLQSQNDSLANLVKNYEQKYQIPLNSNQRPSQDQEEEEQNPQSKELLKKQWERLLIHDTIGSFIEKKKHQDPTNFHKFIEFNKHKIDRWNLKDLFERLDRWTSHLRDHRLLDKVKIKHKLQHSGLATEDVSSMLSPTPNYHITTIDRSATGHKSMLRPTPPKKRLIEVGTPKDSSFRLRPLQRSALKVEAFSTLD